MMMKSYFVGFDRWYRSFYAKYLTGLALFVITVTPYNSEKKKEEQSSSYQKREVISTANMQLLNEMLETTEEPVVSPEEVYLATSPATNEIFSKKYQKMFMPLEQKPKLSQTTPTTVKKADSDQVFDDLLSAYLDKVDKLIFKEKNYVEALKELDKVIVLDPLHPRARKLKQHLNEKIAEELQLQKDEKLVISQEFPHEKPELSLEDIRNTAFEIAEQKILSQAREERALQALTKPRKKKKPNAIHFTPNPYQKNSRHEILEASQGFDDRAKVTNTEDPQKNSFPSQGPVMADIVSSSALPDALPKEEPFVVTKAEDFLIRGKRYFKQGNYSLALISFSKAKKFDSNNEFYYELESLMRLTKENLERLLEQNNF